MIAANKLESLRWPIQLHIQQPIYPVGLFYCRARSAPLAPRPFLLRISSRRKRQSCHTLPWHIDRLQMAIKSAATATFLCPQEPVKKSLAQLARKDIAYSGKKPEQHALLKDNKHEKRAPTEYLPLSSRTSTS